MFDSDEDEFQAVQTDARMQRLLQKKQKKTPASASSKRKRPCSLGEAHPAKRMSGNKLSTPQPRSKAGSKENAVAWSAPVGPAAPRAKAANTLNRANDSTQICASSAVSYVADATDNGNRSCPAQQHNTQHTAEVAEQQDRGAAGLVVADTASSEDDMPTSQSQQIIQPVAGSVMPDAAAVQHEFAVAPLDKVIEHTHQQTTSRCPVCGACLDDITNTDAGRAAHVNACLDVAADGATPGTFLQRAPAEPARTHDIGSRSPPTLEDDDFSIAEW